ncbi:hypothetical protein JW859_14080 [bacterium]|nr:hypothetical protein [bacterium]
MYRLNLLLLLVGLALLAGCPQSGGDTKAQSPATGQSAAATPDSGTSSTANGGSTAQPADGTPDGKPGRPELELDSFKLGMRIAEARKLLGPGVAGTIQERWRYEGLTGMIIAGTYEEPTKMMGSLVFLDGELVGVISNRIQEPPEFETTFNTMLAHYGPTLPQTPEWAAGHRFMQEMQADERQPQRRYLWADPDSQSILVAAYDESIGLATYMLINAVKYDDAAQAIAEIGE